MSVVEPENIQVDVTQPDCFSVCIGFHGTTVFVTSSLTLHEPRNITVLGFSQVSTIPSSSMTAMSSNCDQRKHSTRHLNFSCSKEMKMEIVQEKKKLLKLVSAYLRLEM